MAKSIIFQSLIDFIFPPRCFGCDKDIESGLICNKCFTRVTTTVLGVCPICGFPTSFDKECTHPILQTRIASNTLTRIRALGKYTTPYKGLVHNFKYQHKKKISQVLGLGLANVINSDPILSRADYIVPIPLHSARLRERGYNQSLLLAREAAAGSGITLAECLNRKKNTKSQTKFDYIRRINNINNAFKFNPDSKFSLKDRRVIIIDDVITTGATLAEAAKILIQNGAAEVYGLVVITATND